MSTERSGSGDLCYIDLSLDNYKTKMIPWLCKRKSESNSHQTGENSLEILHRGSANHSLWAKTALLPVFVQPERAQNGFYILTWIHFKRLCKFKHLPNSFFSCLLAHRV